MENEDINEEIEAIAEDYLRNKSLSYKLRTKAKHIMGVNKNNYAYYEEEIKGKNNEDELYDDYIDFSASSDNNAFFSFKQKIKEIKIKKGRGLLFPYRRETEMFSSPKLIKAMILGIKVVLVSDAGRPTISDPGYNLIKLCLKEGITVESLPGPCAEARFPIKKPSALFTEAGRLKVLRRFIASTISS